MSESLDRALTHAASAIGVYMSLAVVQVVLSLYVTIRNYFRIDEDTKLIKKYLDGLGEIQKYLDSLGEKK